jgi:Phosphorylase superfamily
VIFLYLEVFYRVLSEIALSRTTISIKSSIRECGERRKLTFGIHTGICRMSAYSCCQEEKVVNNVLIVIAMAAEAEPLLQKLGLSPIQCAFPNAPCTIYSGCYKGCVVSVVTNGKCSRFGVDNVGTVPAALATFLAVNQLRPDLVINAGTAGGFKRKGAAIGDPFICSLMKNHDRRIPIPGFTEYGTGHHVAHPCPNTVAVREEA